MRPILLAAAAALTLITTGCAESQTCDPIGFEMCPTPDEEGEAITKCAGPADGGDEDGEMIEIEDCAEQGLFCAEDIDVTPSVAGCVSEACGSYACFTLGARQCGFFDTVEECSTQGADCSQYVTLIDCTDTGQVCDDSGEVAVCVDP